jgi:hypothetical protein
MTLLYPKATWRPVDPTYLPRLPLYKRNRVNFHVAVSNAESIHPIFNRTGAASSHLYLSLSGHWEQYVDLDMRAEADYEGNDATWSVETGGGIGATAGQPWNEIQVAELAEFWRWAREVGGFANQVATDSHIGPSSQGLSYHRLGINGNFPASGPLAGRLQHGGGMRYSKSNGKLCPEDARILQVAHIHDLSQSGGSTPPVQPPVVVTPPPLPHQPYRLLNVDGEWGTNTTLRLQEYLGTSVDGVLSHQYHSSANDRLHSAQWDTTKIGSNCIRALQRKVGTGDDGLYGSGSISATQRYLGTPVDGVISPESTMVKALQTRLNSNNL